MKEQVINLMESMGYIEIESKNPYMVSFYKEETNDPRINIYYTTMTMQVQYKSGSNWIEKGLSLSKLEELIDNII